MSSAFLRRLQRGTRASEAMVPNSFNVSTSNDKTSCIVVSEPFEPRLADESANGV